MANKKLSIEKQIDLKLERVSQKASIQSLAAKFGVTYNVAQAICNKSIAELEAAAAKEEDDLFKANKECDALLAAKARVSKAKGLELTPEEGTLHIDGSKVEKEEV